MFKKHVSPHHRLFAPLFYFFAYPLGVIEKKAHFPAKVFSAPFALGTVAQRHRFIKADVDPFAVGMQLANIVEKARKIFPDLWPGIIS